MTGTGTPAPVGYHAVRGYGMQTEVPGTALGGNVRTVWDSYLYPSGSYISVRDRVVLYVLL